MHSTPSPQQAQAPRHLASFHPAGRSAEPLFRDWLAPHRDGLFRWTMGLAPDAQARRALAEVAVAIQRLRGPAELLAWLYGAALQAAARQLPGGGLPEAALTGLTPELRAVLRLVSRLELRPEEAMALLPQRIGYVRNRLVQARLRAHEISKADEARIA